jgi:hypothetical protein
MRCVPLLALAAVAAGPAGAAEVYVNGVNVEGLVNQTFTRVNVSVDDKGNVHIDAPGYSVKKVTIAGDGPASAAREEGRISRRYFLVTEHSGAGRAGYDVDLTINGKLVRTLRSDDEQLVSDLTRHLQPGKNLVLLQARKVQPAGGGERPTGRADHVFRVLIGEGSMAGDQVTIEQPLIKFERTAAESNDVRQEFSLTTR